MNFQLSRTRLSFFFLAAAAFALSGMSFEVEAEGGCPPGQYPIGGQGVQGCAPIPTVGAGSEDRPTGRWIKTWGALASSRATGDLGASKGKLSKADAVHEAVTRCSQGGARDCVEAYTYKNQCVAVTSPPAPQPAIYSHGPTAEKAAEAGQKGCRDKGAAVCTLIFSDCSESIYHKY